MKIPRKFFQVVEKLMGIQGNSVKVSGVVKGDVRTVLYKIRDSLFVNDVVAVIFPRFH